MDQPERTPEQILARINELGEIGQGRKNEASDWIVGLRPAAIDWLTSEEKEELHNLQLEYWRLTRESLDTIRARVAAKRAVRRKAMQEANEHQNDPE